MKYKNINCLPQELIEEIQKYVQGVYIYVPIKIAAKKSWAKIQDIKKKYKKEIKILKKNIN